MALNAGAEPGRVVEIISDGDGLAVFGDPATVELFLSTAGVESRDLALREHLGAALGTAAAATQAGAEVAAGAGRWVKLTEESAKAMRLGELMTGSSPGVRRAVVTDKGRITGLLELVKTPGSMLANPAVLAGAAGIMAQLAMQQAMAEITDYLAAIDEKVDDILRGQKDAILAPMIGAGMVIEDVMLVREQVGRVPDAKWATVQGTAETIATTQAHALRQLDGLAEKLEKNDSVAHLAKASQSAQPMVREWLAVLARCFQLQDAFAVLELDRVLNTTPQELDAHREALRIARDRRVEQIGKCTAKLIGRIYSVSNSANAQVLLHPVKSAAVVRTGNAVAEDLAIFNGLLGIDRTHQALEARPWKSAVAEAGDSVAKAAAGGADSALRFGGRAVDGAVAATGRLSKGIAARLPGGQPEKETPKLEQ